jgi:biopolymer transport protein ExbB
LTEETLEKATVAAVPALEQNLPSMSTIASISTMIGLLGTTIGMIRSFKALAQSGAPDAIQLSIGISEALINTAGGLLVAIIAIVGYNMCSQKVDRILQSTDDAAYRMMRLLRNRT